MLRSVSLLLIPFAALFVACSSSASTGTDGGGTTAPPTVASVSVTASTTALVVGGTAQLTATPHDGSGAAISGKTVAWISSSPGTATVSSSGLVTALAAGSATINATVDGVAGTLAVTVTTTPPAAVASVTLSGGTMTLIAGDTTQFTATVKDASGNLLTGRVVTWTSSLPSVATVSSAGVVTAVAAGTSNITATSEGVTSAPGSVTVTAVSNDLLEERVLAQEGFGLALSSSVLQTQAITFDYIVNNFDARRCGQYGDQGADSATTAPDALPYGIRFFFDNSCQHLYQSESITSFASDTINHVYHGMGTGTYYTLAGAPIAALTFDEESDQLGDTAGLTGIVQGFATVTPASTGTTNHVGINCNFGAGGHTLGICQAAAVLNFAGLGRELGFVMTLAIDADLDTDQLTYNATTTSTTGALDALTLTEATPTSFVVNGGTTYAMTALTGQAGSFSLFPNTPTGWTITDSTHDAVFTLNVVDNATRNTSGTIKRLSTGATLASFALDQSGSGTITYSDNTVAAVTSWTLSQ